MKLIIASLLIASSATASPFSVSVGTCLDQVINSVAKEVLTKKVDGMPVGRYGVKTILGDFWVVHPTYSVTLVGSNALGAEPRFQKDYIFSARPDDSCQELNLRETL